MPSNATNVNIVFFIIGCLFNSAKVKTFYNCCKLFPFTFYTTFTHVSRIADEIGHDLSKTTKHLVKILCASICFKQLICKSWTEVYEGLRWHVQDIHISLGLIPNITNKHIWYSFWFNSALCSHGDVALWALVENRPPFIVARNQKPVPLIFTIAIFLVFSGRVDGGRWTLYIPMGLVFSFQFLGLGLWVAR